MAVKKKVSKEQGAALVARVEAKSAEKVTASLAQVKHTLTNIVDDVSNTTTTLLKELRETQDAIEFKKEELSELHKIEGELNTAQEYERLAKEAQANFQTITAELFTRRQRDEEQYKYDLAKRRRDEEDSITARRRLDESLFQAKADALGDTAAKIQELEEALAKVEIAHESDIKAKVAIACSAVKRDLENSHALTMKDEASRNALLTQSVDSLKATIASQAAEIAQLGERLKSAQTQVQDIAVKALESAATQKITVNAGGDSQSVRK